MEIGQSLFTEEFLHELDAKPIDLARIRRLIIAAYNVENNDVIGESGDIDFDKEVLIIGWLNRLLWEHPLSDKLFFRKKPVLTKFISASLSNKIGSLSQFHCPICTEDTSFPIEDPLSPIMVIAIRISAISKQASKG